MGQSKFRHGGERLRLKARAKQSDCVFVGAEWGVFTTYHVGHNHIEFFRRQLGLGIREQVVRLGRKTDDDARSLDPPELGDYVACAGQLNA